MRWMCLAVWNAQLTKKKSFFTEKMALGTLTKPGSGQAMSHPTFTFHSGCYLEVMRVFSLC